MEELPKNQEQNSEIIEEEEEIVNENITKNLNDLTEDSLISLIK